MNRVHKEYELTLLGQCDIYAFIKKNTYTYEYIVVKNRMYTTL